MEKNKKEQLQIYILIFGFILSFASIYLLRLVPKIDAVNLLLIHIFCYLFAFLLERPFLLLFVGYNFTIMYILKVYGMNWQGNIPFMFEILAGSFIINHLYEKLRFRPLTSTLIGLIVGRITYLITAYFVHVMWLKEYTFMNFITEKLYEQVIGVVLIFTLVPLLIYGISKFTVILPTEEY